MLSRLKNIGPAALVTAAFIGPGTVTVCTLAGVNSGYSLLWVMILAVITTISFQEMAARVGLCTPWGLSEAIIERSNHWLGKGLAALLIVSAIFIGNAMYEAGNISGAMLGVGAMLPEGQNPGSVVNITITVVAFALLLSGKYKLIEWTLLISVAMMALCFIVAAIASGPSIRGVLSGLFVPTIPDGNVLLVVGLIGTTVVPYNLFLHASVVKEKWNGPDNLRAARWDTYIAVIIGGLISAGIMITAAAVSKEVGAIENAGDMARLLEPTFGKVSRYAIALGLFAAGLSSCITAPMGAAYAISGLFKNQVSIYKGTWMVILACGLAFSLAGSSPVSVIQYAQVTNGLLLPITAIFLILTVNNRSVMGKHVNSLGQNVLAGSVLLITLLIAYRTFASIL